MCPTPIACWQTNCPHSWQTNCPHSCFSMLTPPRCKKGLACMSTGLMRWDPAHDCALLHIFGIWCCANSGKLMGLPVKQATWALRDAHRSVMWGLQFVNLSVVMHSSSISAVEVACRNLVVNLYVYVCFLSRFPFALGRLNYLARYCGTRECVRLKKSTPGG